MKMEFPVRLVLLIVSVLCLVVIVCGEERKCNTQSLRESPCPKNESCMKIDKEDVCRCLPGYHRESPGANCTQVPTTPAPTTAAPVNSTVEPASHAEKIQQSSVSTGAVTAAVLVPLVLATGGVLVLVGRRYRWLERLQALRGRRYEEVRIGQEEDDDDDPPLA